MADYLERLVRRTLGHLDVVRPDLAPAFAPRAIDTHDRQVDAPSISSLGRSSLSDSGTPADGLTRAGRNHDTPQASFAAASSIDRRPAAIEPSPVVEATFGRTGHVEQSSVTIAMSALEPSAVRSTPRQVGARAAHRQSTPAAGLDAQAPRDSERPAVSITIGRIDVRAIQAPAAAPQVSKPRSSRLRTLEHYLAERNGVRS